MNENFKLGSSAGVFFILPVPGLSKIPFGAPKKIVRNRRASHAFFIDQIENHQKDLDPENPRDFIDLYLNRMEETKVHNREFGVS